MAPRDEGFAIVAATVFVDTLQDVNGTASAAIWPSQLRPSWAFEPFTAAGLDRGGASACVRSFGLIGWPGSAELNGRGQREEAFFKLEAAPAVLATLTPSGLGNANRSAAAQGKAKMADAEKLSPLDDDTDSWAQCQFLVMKG